MSRATVAFGRDQAIFSVVGILSGVAAGRNFADAIAAHVILIMRPGVLLEQVTRRVEGEALVIEVARWRV